MMRRLDADVLLERMRKRFAGLEPRLPYAVAVSGGKDSAVLAYLTAGNAQWYFFLDLGIPEYSAKAWDVSQKLGDVLGIEIERVPIERYGAYLKEGPKTCSVCGTIKRYLFNRVVWERRIPFLMTGHNLDDFLSFYFQNALSGQCIKFRSVMKPGAKMVGRIRPLSKFTDEEIRKVADYLRLPYLKEKCPYGRDSRQRIIKKMMNEWEERMDFKRPIIAFFKKRCEERQGELRSCKVCGFPTSGEVCKFCRLFHDNA